MTKRFYTLVFLSVALFIASFTYALSLDSTALPQTTQPAKSFTIAKPENSYGGAGVSNPLAAPIAPKRPVYQNPVLDGSGNPIEKPVLYPSYPGGGQYSPANGLPSVPIANVLQGR